MPSNPCSLNSGATTFDFTATAFSGVDAAGTELYKGMNLGVTIVPEQIVTVPISLSELGLSTPIVTQSTAHSILKGTAFLDGSANPNGSETAAYFEWGVASGIYTNKSPITQLGNGTTPVSITHSLNGLTGDTTYYYHLVAANGGNMVNGSEGQFTTLADSNVNVLFPVTPDVATTASTNIGEFRATFNGTVTPNGAATSIYFEWGVDTNYGNTTLLQTVGNGWSIVPANFTLTGLTSGTVYHYRLLAYNSEGVTVGLDQQTTTLNTNTLKTARLSWSPPTTNEDGTTISDLSGYKISYWQQPTNKSIINVGNVITYTVSGLSSGIYQFTVSAYDLAGNESSFSNQVEFTI